MRKYKYNLYSDFFHIIVTILCVQVMYSFKNPKIACIGTRVRGKDGETNSQKDKREHIQDERQGEGAGGHTNTQKNKREHIEDKG